MPEDNTDGWFSEETATFGDRLAAAREAARLSQDEFARRLGVKLRTVTAWEDDTAEPRANKLQMMAGMLNVSLMWLLTGQGDGIDPPSEEEAAPSASEGLLTELRQLRLEMGAMGTKLALLEKRLRASFREGASS